MKNCRIVILCFSGLLMNGCFISGVSEDTASFIENKTDRTLQFHYYRNGQEAKSYNLDVLPYTSKKVSYDTLIESPGVYSYYIQYPNIDSLVIKYYNAKSAVHYNSGIQKPTGAAGIGFESGRNLFNENNWNKNVLKDTRRKYIAEYTYTFTEQDYLEAK